jgi:hypothetical protein
MRMFQGRLMTDEDYDEAYRRVYGRHFVYGTSDYEDYRASEGAYTGGLNGITSADFPPEKATSDGGSASYYELPIWAQELGDLIEHKNMNFNRGNIFKAAYRLGDKEGSSELYDLRKIVWFAEREIARLEMKEWDDE